MNNSKPINSLFKYFYKYRTLLIYGIAFVLLSNCFAIVLAPILRIAIDTLVYINLNTDKSSDHHSLIIKFSIICILTIIISAILKGIFMFMMRQTLIIMSRKVEFDQKNEIFKKFLTLNTQFFINNHIGDMMNKISDDVGKVRMFIGPAIMYALNTGIMFCIVITIMFSINAKVAFYVLLPLPFLSYFIFKISNSIDSKGKAIQVQLSHIMTFAQENYFGIRMLKAFFKESTLIDKFSNENNKYQKLYINLIKTEAMFFPVTGLITGISLFLTLLIGGFEVIKGNFTLGNIAEFIYYLNMLMWPVTSLGYITSLIQRAKVSQTRIIELLNTESQIINGDIIINSIQSIEFKKVDFKYPNTDEFVLKNLNFTINTNQKIGIVGELASGKSTILKLLLRQYDVSNGDILINGINIKQFNLDSLYSNMSYSPQEAFLFSDDIANNLSFGSKDLLNKNEINGILKTVCLENDISNFEQKEHTILGERGINLSGGQKQRVAIGRAIAKQSDIIILDNSFSALDNHTEKQLKQNLKNTISNQIFIIISHRISVIEDMDMILVLEDKTIKDFGTHHQLLQKSDYYNQIYLRQSVDSEIVE